MNNMANIRVRLENINDLRLYEIEKCLYNKGKKSYVIQRVKLEENNSQKFAELINKIDRGEVWVKTGKKRLGNVQYQVKGGLRSSEIESVTVKKKVEEDNSIIEVPVSNLSGKFIEMSDENEQILENVKKNLSQIVDALGKHVISHQPHHIETFSRRPVVNVSKREESTIQKVHAKITSKRVKATSQKRVQELKQSKRAHERKMEKIEEEKEERVVERRRKDIKQDQAKFEREKQELRAKL